MFNFLKLRNKNFASFIGKQRMSGSYRKSNFIQSQAPEYC